MLKTQINIHCSNDENQNGYEIVKNFLSQHKEPYALLSYKKDEKKYKYISKKLIEKYCVKNNEK